MTDHPGDEILTAATLRLIAQNFRHRARQAPDELHRRELEIAAETIETEFLKES